MKHKNISNINNNLLQTDKYSKKEKAQLIHSDKLDDDKRNLAKKISMSLPTQPLSEFDEYVKYRLY